MDLEESGFGMAKLTIKTRAGGRSRRPAIDQQRQVSLVIKPVTLD
jgi:hypothetical protein